MKKSIRGSLLSQGQNRMAMSIDFRERAKTRGHLITPLDSADSISDAFDASRMYSNFNISNSFEKGNTFAEQKLSINLQKSKIVCSLESS